MWLGKAFTFYRITPTGLISRILLPFRGIISTSTYLIYRFFVFSFSVFPFGIHVSDYNVSWRQCRHKPELGRGKGKRGFV